MFILRLARQVPDERYREAADRAARTVAAAVPDRQRSGTCCDLAGDGGFLLDCYQELGRASYLDLARSCGRRLQAFRHSERPGIYRVADGPVVMPRLMQGAAGVGAFYLRLAGPGSAPDLVLPVPKLNDRPRS